MQISGVSNKVELNPFEILTKLKKVEKRQIDLLRSQLFT